MFPSTLTTSAINTGALILVAGQGLKAITFQLWTGGARATHYGGRVILDTITPTFTGTKAQG